MKRHAALLGALALLVFGLPQAIAIIVISADFPMGQVSQGAAAPQANSESQLSELVGLYDNDVALMLGSADNYSKEIKETAPNPAAEKELRERASANGEKLNLQSLSSAVAEMVAASPQNAHIIVASAIAMLSEIPGGNSADNRIALAKSALLAIPQGMDKGATIAAMVIGVTAKDQETGDMAKTVISLREYVIDGMPENQKIDSTLALDGAMVYEGVLMAVMATPEFVNLARAYSTARSNVPEGDFSGDQGVTNVGGLGGFGGSGGGGGDTTNPTPTPTPTPTPAPTPAS